ncbi:MAG: Mu transposase C-terminal domain-containing protein [Xenococcus sp. MO_188.B8]|nr:Mu transposase C-terminal domain-containing protein [Xenococcus sp. MO_188.B8]
MSEKLSVSELSESDRTLALKRFKKIQPFLEEGVPLTQIVATENISLSTARRWVARYRKDGLTGLVRKPRQDKGVHRCLNDEVKKLIEGLALQKPPKTIAHIHRQIESYCDLQKLAIPFYRTVYGIVRDLDPGLITLAHEGSKTYKQAFDLLHRQESEQPNAIWQADHTLLDIWIFDEKEQPVRPWLTVIIDDYSRAIAGYYISLDAPSALQTALALRQAIWRKNDPNWHICGIPEILYTDHGSDFTSQHIEQVCLDLKIRLIFSTVGQPRGRGKIERFFLTVNQLLLSKLSGYAPTGHKTPQPVLTLTELSSEFDRFIGEYNQSNHSETKEAPQKRWSAKGFLPQLPESIEELDLLLLTIKQKRRIHRDGIRFQGLRYIDPLLANYVGEDVAIRYDPRDMAEIRIYYQNRFLCRAICPELASTTVTLKEIAAARYARRKALDRQIKERISIVDALMGVKRKSKPKSSPTISTEKTKSQSPRLKRYFND